VEKLIGIRIYDFDNVFSSENTLFFLRILMYLRNEAPSSLVRYSASGEGCHVQTKVDLSNYQCENRQFWSEFYGFDITWLVKNGQFVSEWQFVETFIKNNLHRLVSVLDGKEKKRRNEGSKRERSQNKSTIQVERLRKNDQRRLEAD